MKPSVVKLKQHICLYLNISRIIILTISVFLLYSGSAYSKQKGIDVSIGQGGISAVTTFPNATFMNMRIIDPEGLLVFEENSDGSSVSWTVPVNAQDGLYSYEVRAGKEPKKVRREGRQGLGPKSRAIVESGTVFVQNGSIVPQTEGESGLINSIFNYGTIALEGFINFLVPTVYADQVFNDDVIVQGSECVGFDCVSGENFGFDTLRLKENNLRVHFDDTSTSASFPRNDWRIIINDTTNGGASYFSVEDSTAGRRPFTIEAGAGSHSLYVDSTSRVGIGTSTPVVEMHIVDGDSPTVRLDQDGSSGWNPQAWDVVGNETNFFIRDVTNGSKLPFRIRPGAPTNSIHILASGNVGIGTATPTEKLHVEGNAFVSGNLELGSSREIKDNIEALSRKDAMMTVASLRPVKFNYKAAPDEESIGFIAEDVPDLVATKNRKSISTMDVVAVLTKVVQEQQKAIEELTRTVHDLEKQLDTAQLVH